MQLDPSVIRKIRMRTVYRHIPWKWGDEWAAKRRKRLNEVRGVASVSEHDIILPLTNTEGAKDGESDD